ncbi:hypothetical protein HDU78_004009 [Chytriomyces hyalinus]|nr:hypothetical protein HDU78_004009 [Chytriomyces hyalinus]
MGNGQSRHAEEVGLWHFELLQVVGRGAFGKVRIAMKRDTKTRYALKYMDKMQCIRMHAIQNIFRERALLQDLNHPFIVNLNYAFQDDQSLFFVLDLKTGGDLRHHLNSSLGFEEAAVKLWALEIASAVQYLHCNNIVHRDVKPDNVLLDEKGHAHLTDFNIAVNIDKSSILKSRSGTMAYLAPEVFDEHGYYWQVDWWAYGVMLYELIYYKRPFRGKTAAALLASIRESEVNFPKTNLFSRSAPVEISIECKAFLLALLDRNPLRRLGCRVAQVADIREHPWLCSVDWKLVEKKQVQPLFVPNPQGDNFDPRINLEEFLQDGFPVEAAPRPKKNKRTSGKKKVSSEAVFTPTKHNSTPSNPNMGSFLAYMSAGSSAGDQARRTSAADAAATAGNVELIMKHYQKSQTPGFKLFGKKADGRRQKLTETERIELELRFMADHFLPFDRTKHSTNANPKQPVPPVPLLETKLLPEVIVDESLLSANRIILDETTARNHLIHRDGEGVNPELWKSNMLTPRLSYDGHPQSHISEYNSTYDAMGKKDSSNNSMQSSLSSLDLSGILLDQLDSSRDASQNGSELAKNEVVLSKYIRSHAESSSDSLPHSPRNADLRASSESAQDNTKPCAIRTTGLYLRGESPHSSASAGTGGGSGRTKRYFRVTSVPLPDSDIYEGDNANGAPPAAE